MRQIHMRHRASRRGGNTGAKAGNRRRHMAERLQAQPQPGQRVGRLRRTGQRGPKRGNGVGVAAKAMQRITQIGQRGDMVRGDLQRRPAQRLGLGQMAFDIAQRRQIAGCVCLHRIEPHGRAERLGRRRAVTALRRRHAMLQLQPRQFGAAGRGFGDSLV